MGLLQDHDGVTYGEKKTGSGFMGIFGGEMQGQELTSIPSRGLW